MKVNVTMGFCLGLASAMGFAGAMSASFLVSIDSVTYSSTPFSILTQEAVWSSNRVWTRTSILYRSSSRQTFTFKTGPILVFLRIHHFTRVFLSFRGIVYSRQRCCICNPSSASRVLKYCPFSTSFQPTSENRLENCWSSDN